MANLFPVLTDEKELLREFRKRNQEYEKRNVLEKNTKMFIDEGFVYQKKLKKGRVSLRKIKPIDQRLENKVWCLFYRMGYY